MFKYITIVILTLVLIGLVLPQAVNAALVPALVPCGRHEDDPTTPEVETDRCNLCHIFVMLQRLLNGVGLAAAGWAVIFIVIGGIVIMAAGGSPEKASQGKKMITYAIIGIIIAFGAWLVINTVMNALVGPPEKAVAEKRIPWPWNKITCAPTELVTHKECVGAACKEIEGEGEDQCTSNADCGIGEEKNYCACQESSSDYTLIKATKLSDAETCTQECKASKSTTYCSLVGSGSQMTCRSKEDLANTSALCLKLGFNYERIGLECYSTTEECIDDIYSTYRRCRGLPTGEQCTCYGSDYYPGPPPFPCQTNELAILLRSPGGYVGASGENVISCSEKQDPDNENCRLCALGTHSPDVYYCHLQYKDEPDVMATSYNDEILCKQECSNKCDLIIPRENCEAWCCLKENKHGQDNVCKEITVAEWCQRSAPAGSENWVLNPPPGGAKPEQKGDASAQLTSFINCMYGKLPNLKINSVSSNALCDDSSCDISQAGVCGHAGYSCHFGGANCTGESYAVDFHTNVSCPDIKTAAQQCNSTAWVNWENNHTHVSVNGQACGCSESGAGTPCP